MAKGTKKSSISDEEREIRKALRTAWEVDRARWLSGATPMTPPMPTPTTPPPQPRPVKASPSADGWTLLVDALDRVTEVCLAPSVAKKLLVGWLADRDIRWRCLRFEGWQSPALPGSGDPAFWQEFSPKKRGQIVSHIEWNQSWARIGGVGGYMAVRVEVAEEDLAKMLLSLVAEPAAAVPEPAPDKPVESKPEPKQPGWRVRSIIAKLPEFFPDGVPDICADDAMMAFRAKVFIKMGRNKSYRDSIRRVALFVQEEQRIQKEQLRQK